MQTKLIVNKIKIPKDTWTSYYKDSRHLRIHGESPKIISCDDNNIDSCFKCKYQISLECYYQDRYNGQVDIDEICDKFEHYKNA